MDLEFSSQNPGCIATEAIWRPMLHRIICCFASVLLGNKILEKGVEEKSYFHKWIFKTRKPYVTQFFTALAQRNDPGVFRRCGRCDYMSISCWLAVRPNVERSSSNLRMLVGFSRSLQAFLLQQAWSPWRNWKPNILRYVVKDQSSKLIKQMKTRSTDVGIACTAGAVIHLLISVAKSQISRVLVVKPAARLDAEVRSFLKSNRLMGLYQFIRCQQRFITALL